MVDLRACRLSKYVYFVDHGQLPGDKSCICQPDQEFEDGVNRAELDLFTALGSPFTLTAKCPRLRCASAGDALRIAKSPH
jgi:hypothetical protein